MYAQDLIEVLCAAHLSACVASPFKERGGIMIVGAPATLKSTFLDELDRQYSDALSMSDLNAKALTALRDQIAQGTFRTLVFPEFGKIYERNDATAANLEGALRAMTAEGFRAAAFEDQRVNRLCARALVLGAMTPATQARRFEAWEESGFNRRFLWSLIRLADPTILDAAVMEWQRIDFRIRHVPQAPGFGQHIPNNTTREERTRCRVLVKYQPGGSNTQQTQLLVKVLAVLKWWYEQTENPRNPMEVVEAFGESLGREGAVLELKPLPRTLSYRTRQREDKQQRSQAARVLQRARIKSQPKKKKGRR